ncbi:beta-lactamase/transpeptidase-like protein [Mycena alexandri]|uniref:Beta-lactamase/transpeptidase-like protein n=1 Tax=Mycena alexandri TaxID=1745969 RepID=A0AAD6WYZ1_9AGAR|nr:beta-lactamase/transpeptidase-like protein [Mycena alexandri]
MAPLTFSAAQKDVFRKILSDGVASKSTPAVFFGVTSADGLIYTHTEGKKLVDDPTSAAIDEDTVFWICSQTKLITTIAALQLIEQGKIELDTPAENVLPELANPVLVTGYDNETGRPSTTTPAKGKITLGHLLNHSSGLDPSGIKLGQANGLLELYSHSDADVATFFKIIKVGIYLSDTFRSYGGQGSLPECTRSQQYLSQLCYIDRLCRLYRRTALGQDHIFAPLGITSASFYLTPPLKERLLPLSYRTKSGLIESWKGPPVIDQNPAHVRVFFGGWTLYSSQKDYLTVLRHLLQIKAGTATSPILTPASVDNLFERTHTSAGATTLDSFTAAVYGPYINLPAGGVQFGYGLSVNTVDVPGKRKAGSGSWGGWANTSYFVDPTTGVAAVFGTQLAPFGDKDHHRLLDALERALYAALSAEP